MGLRLYPAIDLKGGQVVRLRRGDMSQATVYSGRPGDQARTFAAQGFGWLHAVDLDGAFAGPPAHAPARARALAAQGCGWLQVVDLGGAFAGRPANAAAVESILAAAPGVPVQLGGGIRDRRTSGAWRA